MQRSKVHRRAELIDNFCSNDLMVAKFRSAMHDAVRDGRRRAVEMFPDRLGESGKCIALRFMDTVALQQRGSVKGTNMQRAIIPSDAIGAPSQQRLFVARAGPVNSKLQR